MAEPIRSISDTCIIPETCQETFLPRDGQGTAYLQHDGILSGGQSRLVPGYDHGRLCANMHILEFTIDGGASYVTESGNGVLSPGDLFVGPAGTGYRYWVDRGHWTSLWFCLEDGTAWSNLVGTQVQVRKSSLLHELLAAVQGLLSESTRAEPFAARLRALFAEQLVLYLRRELETYASPRERELSNQLRTLWEQVGADLAHPWTVETLARRVHMSPAHFHRINKRHHGKSPIAMLKEMRMKRAEALLLNRSLPLKAIADLLGYATPFALSKAFTRYKGVSPATFRAQHYIG